MWNGFESTLDLIYVDINDPSLRRIPKFSAESYSNLLKRKPMALKIIKEIEKNAVVL